MQDPVACGDAEHGKEPDQRSERDRAHGAPGREHAADERDRERQEHQRRQPHAGERGLEQEQDRDRGANPHLQQAVLGGLALGRLAEQLDAIAERELDLGQPGLHGGGDRAEVGAADVGEHVDVVGAVVARDVAGGLS